MGFHPAGALVREAKFRPTAKTWWTCSMVVGMGRTRLPKRFVFFVEHDVDVDDDVDEVVNQGSTRSKVAVKDRST
jgi:hypothetical protein